MKAYKAAEARNAKQRYENARNVRVIGDTLEYFLLSSALELNEQFGFGEKRLSQFITGMTKRMDEYIDKYGDDCLLTALRFKAAQLGCEIIFTETGAKR